MTAGGRVIGVNATASDLKSAVALVYEAMKSVKFSLMHYRTDIAYRFVLLFHSAKAPGPSEISLSLPIV
jgi:phosphoribosylamine-glycine ligase